MPNSLEVFAPPTDEHFSEQSQSKEKVIPAITALLSNIENQSSLRTGSKISPSIHWREIFPLLAYGDCAIRMDVGQLAASYRRQQTVPLDVRLDPYEKAMLHITTELSLSRSIPSPSSSWQRAELIEALHLVNTNPGQVSQRSPSNFRYVLGLGGERQGRHQPYYYEKPALSQRLMKYVVDGASASAQVLISVAPPTIPTNPMSFTLKDYSPLAIPEHATGIDPSNRGDGATLAGQLCVLRTLIMDTTATG